MIKLSKEEEDRALELHKKALVVDAKSFPFLLKDKYFERAKKGSLDVAMMTVAGNQSFMRAYRSVRDVTLKIDRLRDIVALATSVNEIERANKEGKIAVLFDFQDSMPVEDDLSLLRVFYKLGVRCIQLCYALASPAGCAYGERVDYGLTYFGMDLIDEMNKLRILVDLSHCSDATTMDALEYSKSTVVFTHANVRSVCDNPRNKTDEQIKALAEKGGVIGVESSIYHVSKKSSQTIDDLLNHIDYIVKLVGVDYVGLGLDLIEDPEDRSQFEPWIDEVFPQVRYIMQRDPKIVGTLDAFYNSMLNRCIRGHVELPNITRGLISRGYSDQEIEKILGGNWIRAFGKVLG